MSRSRRYVLVTLAGCAMGAVVTLVALLNNPGTGLQTGQLALLFLGASALGGLLTFLRYAVKDRGQDAGRRLRGGG